MEIVNGAEITYLYANGQPFAYHKKSGEDKTINYLHLDYQGSIMAITSQNGNIIEERNYDAWGRPRSSSTLAYVLPNPFGSGSDIRRGYTFHEHLEEFNLINMNGRAYDPLLARFLNADPLIQDNTDAQNYNRYSYVLNNPTKYTDPSGYAYNGFEAFNAAYQNMLEGMRYDMVTQQEMDFLSFKEMVKMNGNFGGGNGGTGNPSGIEGSGYIESDNDPVHPPVGIGGQPFTWPPSNSDVKPTRASGVVKLSVPYVKNNNTWAASALGLIATDISIPDPSDAVWPKWAAYGALASVAVLSVHANSLKSTKPNLVYEIFRFNSKSIQTMKYGITSNSDFITRIGNPRPEYQCAILNNLFAKTGNYYWYSIITRTPDRQSALNYERYLVEQYRETHNGNRPPLQFRP